MWVLAVGYYFGLLVQFRELIFSAKLKNPREEGLLEKQNPVEIDNKQEIERVGS